MENLKEKPESPKNKDFKGPFHSDVVIEEKKEDSKFKKKEDSKNQKLPPSEDECGNGY